MQTASETSTEQGSPLAGPPGARIDGVGGIGLEFASKELPNGISPKKVRELAMRKVDPLPLQHDELGVYMRRSEILAWRQRQKRTYLEARELGLIPGVIKA